MNQDATEQKSTTDAGQLDRRVMRRWVRDEWIARALEAGAHSADYADSLFLAYTDNGESDMTPEQIIAEVAAIMKQGGKAA